MLRSRRPGWRNCKRAWNASLPRNWRRLLGAALVAAGPACVVPSHAEPDRASAIAEIVRNAMTKYDLRAVIVRVVVDGKVVATQAFGESMTGEPATPDMHFRNGNVAFAYLTTLLLQLVDEKKITLDDKLEKWLPDLPSAERISLRMLANMTSGYADYVRTDPFAEVFYENPFRHWTPQDLIKIGVSKP